MKLVYFQDPKRNFGDDLNPWLWDQLLPGKIDDDPSLLLLGLGTILEPWFVKDLNPAARKIVIGSGAGMSVPSLQLGPEWDVHCVRGPLTASYLGIGPDKAATDPAMCIRDLWPRPREPRRKIGFMPHHGSVRQWDWRRTSEAAGLEYVDPHGEPLAVLDQIANLRLILTEAMHGAIVADALRVPWFPIQINPTNYVGKWHDWGASVRMPIHFKPLPFLYDPLHGTTLHTLLSKGAKTAAYELRRKSSKRDQDQAKHLMQQYASVYGSYLSDDRDLDRAINHFRGVVDLFRSLG